MHYALVENGLVTHVLRVPPENIFPPQIAARYVSCAEDVEVGWTFADGVFSGPSQIPESELSRQLALREIERLERESLMNRITRESIMTMARERAAAMGMTEAQLIAKNKGYAALKALDDEIAALRAQL